MSLGKVATRECTDGRTTTREKQKERKNETLFLASTAKPSPESGEREREEDGSTRISPCRHSFWGMGMYIVVHVFLHKNEGATDARRRRRRRKAISAHI